MSTIASISQQTVTGDEIFKVVSQLEPYLRNVPIATQIVTLLSIVIVLQFPQITPEELRETVKSVSQYICLTLDSIGETPQQVKAEMN